MRILYIDIDSLRPDHLSCYGYHRQTSPNIDKLAERSTRFDNVYITDAPCLPSRTALWSGRCGFHTGVVGHGGTAGEPFVEGPSRGFRDQFAFTSWMTALRQAGLYTATISSFGERHAAWHWYAGYNEIYNPGKGGNDRAEEVTPYALDWIKRNGARDNWFLHVNLWDPHTTYRTPPEFGNPFADDPLPEWLTDEVRQRGWEGFGPHSAQELPGHDLDPRAAERYPDVPQQLDSMATLKRWIDGYDTGIRYADEHVGQIVAALQDAGVFDDTVIVISADHSENQGELNVWGDHQTADHHTCRIPLIIRWPGVTDRPRIDNALYQHYDWAATLIEMAGGTVPDNWDGQSFADAFRAGESAGRPFVVTSQGAWAVQRGIRFDLDGRSYMCLRTYHDGHKMLDPVMLFDLSMDPHEENDIAGERPDVVAYAMSLLAEWESHMMLTSTTDVDPLMTVLREGGPFHTRGRLPDYIERLKATGRAHHAEHLAARHPDELNGV
jgi:arylsulfatase A-like enzyme